jgi:hypothetical protein
VLRPTRSIEEIKPTARADSGGLGVPQRPQ